MLLCRTGRWGELAFSTFQSSGSGGGSRAPKCETGLYGSHFGGLSSGTAFQPIPCSYTPIKSSYGQSARPNI
ncbi:hypothetical protein RSAG8_04287, partial [Rhizoctonia solani AG-8 WAC10335]